MNKLWVPIILLLAAVNVALFYPGSLYFLNDDLLHIPLTDTGVFFQTNSIRPLHELLVKMDLLIWGKHAYGYHITALILHFIVCIQLYDLCFVMQTNCFKVERSHAKNIAGLSVVLFLAYAGHSESIAWILGRTPVLSTVFFMVTMRLFFTPKFNCVLVFAGAICFGAALFTYEQSILLPLMFLWVAFIEKDKLTKRWNYLYAAGTILIAVIYVIARKVITSEVVGKYEGESFVGLNFKMLMANAFRFVTRLWLNPNETTFYFIASAVLIIGVLAVIINLRKQFNPNKVIVVFLAGMILLLLAPVLSLGISIHSFESGRYLYLPSIFLAIVISMLVIYSFNHFIRFRPVLMLLLIGLLAYWLWGKNNASRDYKGASEYVIQTDKKVKDHFVLSADTLYMDSLRLTVNRLPVFRLGFKEGMKWLHPQIDTNKIVVRSFIEE